MAMQAVLVFASSMLVGSLGAAQAAKRAAISALLLREGMLGKGERRRRMARGDTTAARIRDQAGAELRPAHVRARQSANASMSQSLRSSAAIAFTSLQRAAFSSEERV